MLFGVNFRFAAQKYILIGWNEINCVKIGCQATEENMRKECYELSECVASSALQLSGFYIEQDKLRDFRNYGS